MCNFPSLLPLHPALNHSPLFPSFLNARHARWCALIYSSTRMAHSEWFQFPWLHPEPVHQQRAAGFHQDPDEAWRGARLWAMSKDLLSAWNLWTRRRSWPRLPLSARLERPALRSALFQPMPGQQVSTLLKKKQNTIVFDPEVVVS